MNTISNQPVGIYPSSTYTTDDHTGATRLAMYPIQNGKFVQVTPTTAITPRSQPAFAPEQ
jgi:hypothetical protein